MSKKQFTYAKYAPESMMSEKIKTPHPRSRPKEVNLNHRCLNVEKHFSGYFQLLVSVFCRDHFLLFLSDLDLGICLLIIGFAPRLKLHLDPNLEKLCVDLRGIRR